MHEVKMMIRGVPMLKKLYYFLFKFLFGTKGVNGFRKEVKGANKDYICASVFPNVETMELVLNPDAE